MGIYISGSSSPIATIPFTILGGAANTSPAITSVTTAYAGPVIAQNTFIVVKGTNLVPADTPAGGAIWSSAPSFAIGMLPTQLAGVSVTVANKPAFVYFYCSAATDPACPQDQLNILTPLDATIGSVPVVVAGGAVSSPAFTANLQPVAPSFLLFGTAGYVAATHANYTLVGPTSLYPGFSTPAAAGETIVLYAVGFGLPATPLINGSASQSGSLPVLPVCQVGGAPAHVAFAGLAGPGLYQLNVAIPPTAANGDNAVGCTYDGSTTPAGDLIAVQTLASTTLTITTSGAGGGTVGSSPAGTSCGSGCLSFTAGTVVALTATPSTGSTFAEWSGACSGAGGCTLTMNVNQAVAAAFNLSSSSGNGIAVASVSSTSPLPLTVLQIATSGVDAANPVTLQFSSSSGFSATEQAVRVQSDGTVVAGVPLYVDPGTGQIGPGAVSLVLTQGTQSSAPTSLVIQDLPPLSSYGTQLGQISQSFLIFEALLHAARLNEFQAAQQLVGAGVDTSSAQTAMQNLLSASIWARADVDGVMANNGAVFAWGSLADGTSLQFDSTQLDVMDRIVAVYLSQQFLSSGVASAASQSLRQNPLSAHAAPNHPEFGYSSIATLLSCLVSSSNGPCFMQAQAALQSSPNATDTGTACLIGLQATLKQSGAGQEAGVAGLALGYAHLAAAMDSLTHSVSAAAFCSGRDGCTSEAEQNDILAELRSDGAQIVSSIVQSIAQVPVMLSLESAPPTVKLADLAVKSIAAIVKAGASGQTAVADSTGVSLVSPSTLPQLSGHLGYMTGTVQNAGSQGTAAPQNGLNLCCFGASQLGIAGLADLGGNYSVLLPIGVPGTNYSQIAVNATDPLTGASFGSEVVDLTGLNSSTPLQVPPLLGSGPTSYPYTYTGAIAETDTTTMASPSGCTPDPEAITGTSSGSAQLTSSALVENSGAFSGILTLGTQAGSIATPTLTCTDAGGTVSTIPGAVASASAPGSTLDLSGTNNGGAITFSQDTQDQFCAGMTACSITGAVSVGASSVVVTLTGSASMTLPGGLETVTLIFSLTKH
jgi:uncharacterized protein (TIGR03437 family)